MAMVSPGQKSRQDDGGLKRFFVPVERSRRRPEAIADRIRDTIRANGLLPGDRLPQEKELIDGFKAAKGTVREAMKALETQGLVYTRSGPGGGAFVARPSARHAMELLGNYFFFDQPSLADIYAIRKVLEPELAALLAGNVEADDLARLEHTIRIYDHPPTDLDEQYHQRIAELDFHSLLAELSPSPLLGFLCGLMHNLLRELPVARQIYADPAPASREEGLLFQHRLMAALKQGRSDAARRITYDHMVTAERYMIDKATEIGGRKASG